MTDTLNLATGQPEEPPYTRLLRESREELGRLRALVLYERNQRKIPLESLDEIERGLSFIIRNLDGLRSTLLTEDIPPTIEEAQTSVRNARKCLLVASGLLNLEKSLSARQLEVLFEKYEEFADFLLAAIENLTSD